MPLHSWTRSCCRHLLDYPRQQYILQHECNIKPDSNALDGINAIKLSLKVDGLDGWFRCVCTRAGSTRWYDGLKWTAIRMEWS